MEFAFVTEKAMFLIPSNTKLPRQQGVVCLVQCLSI